MRATWSQVSLVSWRRPLPSAPSTSASGARSGNDGEIAVAARVEADHEEAALLERGEPAREILHADQRHVFERAGGGLGQRAGRIRAVALRGDDRRRRERGGRAEDGADIVRIGDLVEHQHDAFCRHGLDRRRGQGVGFQIEALMHGIGQQPFGDRGRPHQFRLDRVMPSSASRRAAFSVASSLRTWRAGFRSAAVTVCQPYITTGPSAAGRRLSRRARSKRSRRSICWRVAPGCRRNERVVVLPSRCLNRSAPCGTASIDLKGVAAHKTRESGRQVRPFFISDQYGATAFWESVPSGKGGGL